MKKSLGNIKIVKRRKEKAIVEKKSHFNESQSNLLNEQREFIDDRELNNCLSLHAFNRIKA